MTERKQAAATRRAAGSTGRRALRIVAGLIVLVIAYVTGAVLHRQQVAAPPADALLDEPVTLDERGRRQQVAAPPADVSRLAPPEAETDAQVVSRFVGAVRDEDTDLLAKIINFPIPRPYPLPAMTRYEFFRRYEEIFDEEFTRTVVGATDYGRIGLRGLQLGNGLVWFDDSGRVFRINHMSGVERRELARLIELERGRLHESLRDYRAPILDAETCTYRVRIDAMEGGGGRVRYAAWNVDAHHGSLPDIVLYGTRHVEGNAGEASYYFANGAYRYLLCCGMGWGADYEGLDVYRTHPDSSYEDLWRWRDDAELLLSEPIVKTAEQSHYRGLANRLRECG